MTKLWSATALAFLIAVSTCAQNARPTPRPAPPDDGEVVRISTNLIQIDVTVTDSKGKPVTDIRPDEIEIFENGEQQKITNFSFISAIGSRGNKDIVTDKDAVPIPTGVLRPEQIRRTFALVVDDLSLSFQSAYQTRRALKKFVDDQMQGGDLVAIIRTGAGIGALQQFTSDKRLLYAAIEKVRWNPRGAGGISPFAPIESASNPIIASGGEEEIEDEATAASGQSLDEFRGSYFAVGTLGALRYIVTGMSDLPGRKSVILFSDGFRLVDEQGQVLEFMRQLVDTANRASVVFYTVDARGLVYTGFTAADSISDVSPMALSTRMSARNQQLIDTQEGLGFLAVETGGLALRNNNSLSDGVRKALEDQSYYLVAYEPDSDTFDPSKRKFNKLEVKVTRPGVTTRHRSGFFNVAERQPGSAAAALTPVGQMQLALVSPFAVNGVNLRLNALFANDAKNGSYVRSLLHVDADDLKFTDQDDGTKKAVFDVLAMSFGDNGQIIDQLAKGYTMTMKPEAYKKILTEGLVYNFVFPVKKPGAYQYRVALRDFQGGQLGSASQFIEVPNLKKKRLTVSSLVLESLSIEQWRAISASQAPAIAPNPMSDTALRRVKVGTVLRYGFEIYNGKLGPSKQPALLAQVRVFRDGKLILDGKQTPPGLDGQTDFQRIKMVGAVALGDKMPPGDYILQIVVTDTLAKPKQQTATQYIQFEVVSEPPA